MITHTTRGSWTATADYKPMNQQAVEWLTSDAAVVRGWYIQGLWFFEDRSMYVYYTPTLWRSREH